MNVTKTICLHDRKEIESFLRENVYLNIYCIGDLDDFFWPHTTWYGCKEDEEIQAIALLYSGRALLTLVALSEENKTKYLLQNIVHLLPRIFHAHLCSGAQTALEYEYNIKPHGKFYKMALKDKSLPHKIDCSEVVQLMNEDLDEILEFYKQAYPGNWFDSRMLQTKRYYGIRKDNRIISVAGVHVYSEKYKVVALGNIVTHPDYRSNGFGKTVTAKLCQELSERIDHIGLNVKSDNGAAISMYEKLGFVTVVPYWEFTFEIKQDVTSSGN